MMTEPVGMVVKLPKTNIPWMHIEASQLKSIVPRIQIEESEALCCLDESDDETDREVYHLFCLYEIYVTYI